jgi:uncharacterized protein (DUF58 family)
MRISKRTFVFFILIFLFFLIAANLKAGLLYFLASLMVATLIASLISPLFMVRGLEMERNSPSFVCEGKKVNLKLTLQNKKGRKYLLLVKDKFAGGEGEVFIPFLPKGTLSVDYTLSPRRGVYRKGKVSIVNRFPFGLLEARREFEIESKMVVHPKIYPLKTLPLLESGSFPGELFHAERRSLKDEYYGVREYKPGDSLRFIHWKKTASREKPVVKEFEEWIGSYLSIFIDNRLKVHHRESLDELVRVAASVAYYGLHSGHPLLLFSYSQKLLRPSWGEALHFFASLPPSRESDLNKSRLFIPRSSTFSFFTTPFGLPSDSLINTSQRNRCRFILYLYEDGFKTSPFYLKELSKLFERRVIIYRAQKKGELISCLSEPWKPIGELTDLKV